MSDSRRTEPDKPAQPTALPFSPTYVEGERQRPSEIWVPRSDAVSRISSIYDSGERVAHIVGVRGSGKSALARMFIDANPGLFPPGTVEAVSGPFPFIPTGEFNLERTIKKETSALILDAVPWSMESVQQIQTCLIKHPLLRVITTGTTPPPSGFGSTVTLSASLTDSEIRETLYRRLAVLGEPSTNLVSAIFEHPELLSEARKSFRSLLMIANQLFGKRATDFDSVTLFGADGKPLMAGSTGFQRVALEIGGVNEELLELLKSKPELLRTLTPRKFEELVAELLERLGYKTELTPASKDGGFDIYAAKKDGVATLLYLVECKRYVPPNKVGVEIVRGLHGTVSEKNATGGIVATTSLFTAGAREFQRKLEYRMELHDYAGIQEWLKRATTCAH
jgi:restriction system protein